MVKAILGLSVAILSGVAMVLEAVERYEQDEQ